MISTYSERTDNTDLMFQNCNFKNDLCQKDVREHSSCVNALQFSHNERLLGSGGDDGRVRVWNVDEMIMRKEPKPTGLMERMHESNIFSVEFDLEYVERAL